MNVNAGWRIYDIKNRKIVDEDSYMDDMEWHMSGDTPEEARHGLPQKRNAINKSGYHAGKQYGIRIRQVGCTFLELIMLEKMMILN